MAQTTTAMNAVNAKIEVSTNGTIWTDISGSTNSVQPSEQDVAIGTMHTFDGDMAILTPGKRNYMEIAIQIVYTPTTGEAFEVVRAVWEGTKQLYLRYSPEGGATGDQQFTSCNSAGAAAAGILSRFQYPGGKADDANPILCGFTLLVAGLLASTISA